MNLLSEKRKIRITYTFIILLALSMNLQSQESKDDDANALAKESANPIANLISVPHFGSQPVKLQVQYYYNVVRPTLSAKSTLMVQLVFLFPPKK